MNKLTKKDIIVDILIFFIIVGVFLAVRYIPRRVPLEECSEVYKRYSQVEGVRATYVKDYPLNDTLTVGVTLLEATTDSGWAMLQEDFGLPVIPKEYEERFMDDSNRVTTKYFPKNVPLFVGGDTIKDDLIAISFYKHSICHFVISSKEQRKAILYKQFEDNIKIKNDE